MLVCNEIEPDPGTKPQYLKLLMPKTPGSYVDP